MVIRASLPTCLIDRPPMATGQRVAAAIIIVDTKGPNGVVAINCKIQTLRDRNGIDIRVADNVETTIAYVSHFQL